MSRAVSNGSCKGNNIAVFSGGSAANNLVDVFDQVRQANACSLSYIIPVSDNGGSSSELIRVFGGPGIGDVRSRLVRLIPEEGEEATAIKHFFNHRLPKEYAVARAEWLDITEATHSLWTGISSPKKELIRSILNSMNLELLKRVRPTSRFDYSGASIGNLFLTGARLFTGSFEAAIYLLSSICAVPSSVSVFPVLNTNFALHIAAGLADGTVITGQNSISHPSEPTAAVPGEPKFSPNGRPRSNSDDENKAEDANGPGTLPSLRKPAIAFSKDQEEDLPSRIERLWYINPYGQQITIPANPRVLEALRKASCIVYSIGSLYTSIIPSLILGGVGEAVASPAIKSKILILNGTIDRETGPSSDPYTALDFVGAIANACCESRGLPKPEPESYWHYVTHIIYLDNGTSPKVDRDVFSNIGIETMRLYGRKGEDGKGNRKQRMASKPFNVAVVGYGLSAKVFHIPLVLALPSDFKLYGIVQRSPKLDDDCSKDHPGIKSWRSVDEVYSDPNVDVVIITSIPETHFEMCKAALEAGKNVVCEKPFVPTSQEAGQLAEIAKKNGKQLAVYQNRRWDADFLTLRKIMADGALGDIAEFETHFDRHRPEPPADNWKAKEGPAHGAVYDLGTHLLDQVYSAFGNPEKVTGFVGNQRVGVKSGPPDSFTVLLQYGQMLVTAKAGVVSPEEEQLRYWVRGTKGSFRKCHLDVQEDQLKAGAKPGSAGFGEDPESHYGTLTTGTDGKLKRSVFPTVPPATYVEYYRLFGKALRGEGEVPVKAEEARDVLRIIEAALQSSKEERSIRL
ncbi:UPF0052-domain-containing protein [Hortaea werneckii]|nr:UPF0052-domain-containing protein [Hortaea werneckii]